MKAVVCALTVWGLAVGVACGEWGFFDAERSEVTINGTVYSLWSGGPGLFDQTWLGSFDADGGGLQIEGYQANVWKNGASDVKEVLYFYTVYPAGARPKHAHFSSLGGSWLQNHPRVGTMDQTWGNTMLHIDLLKGLGPGKYVLEIYGQAVGSEAVMGAAPTAEGGVWPGCFILYDNNGGEPTNYSATFTVRKKPEGR